MSGDRPRLQRAETLDVGARGQERYRIAERLEHTRTLMGELQRCEVRRTDTGHARYGVWAGEDGHGDLLMALGIATVVAERHSVYRAAGGVVEARSVGPRDEGERTRPRGTSHRSSTRQLMDHMRRLREDYHRRTAGNSAPLGWPQTRGRAGPCRPENTCTGYRGRRRS